MKHCPGPTWATGSRVPPAEHLRSPGYRRRPDRGNQKKAGRYFGPYTSVGAARSALSLLQKSFKVRQCDDYFFNHRSQPCLQYQIDRCSAPCVGFISKESYQNDVESTIAFLEGKSHLLINRYAQNMEAASTQLDYEKAAKYRNKIE